MMLILSSETTKTRKFGLQTGWRAEQVTKLYNENLTIYLAKNKNILGRSTLHCRKMFKEMWLKKTTTKSFGNSGVTQIETGASLATSGNFITICNFFTFLSYFSCSSMLKIPIFRAIFKSWIFFSWEACCLFISAISSAYFSRFCSCWNENGD